MKMPLHFYQFFWDAEFTDLDQKKHASYIIERLLETGDLAAIQWLFSVYAKNEVINVLKKTRKLSSKSITFWAFYFGLPLSQLQCTEKFLNQPQSVSLEF